MKMNIMKVSLFIMALTTMITMTACPQINNDTASKVCTVLSEKYGEDFVAVKIGDRLNTDSAKLYVHPADNEDIVFSAKLYKDTGVVEDDYIEEKVNYQVEQIIKNAFAEEEISVSSRCMVVTYEPIVLENEVYTPESFSEKYDVDHYTVYLTIKDGDISAEKIINAVKDASKNVGVKLVIAGYIFTDDKYLECSSAIQENPDMSITMIEALSPIASFDINVDNGACSISEIELAEKLGRN